MQNKILMGHLFALVTILLWGTTFISTKVLLRSFTPIEILFFRFIMGLIVLFLIYPYRLKVTDKKQEWIFAGAGLSGITLYYLFENIALVYAPASNVGVITATAPFFTALLACRFLAGEALQKKFIVGFVLAIAGISKTSIEAKAPPVRRVTEHLLGHYTEKVTLEELAAVACMNKYSLLRLFTKTEGITPYRYLETIRIGKAKELLAQDLEPAEVALMTGFSDQSHFSKFFKEVIGLTPGQYRNIFKVKQ